MKKYVPIILSASLLISGIGTTVNAADVQAKTATSAHKKAVAKKGILLGLKGFETEKQLKKIAKKKGWTYVNGAYSIQVSSVKYVTYKNVMILGKKSTVTFSFLNGKLAEFGTYFEHKKKHINDVKTYYNTFYPKVKKDLGNQKGKVDKYDFLEENGKKSRQYFTYWTINKPVKTTIEYSVNYNGLYYPNIVSENIFIYFGKERDPALSAG